MKHEIDVMVPNIEVLHEDEEVLVIHKPSGLVVHEDGKSSGPTVVDWFLSRAPSARGVGESGYSPAGKVLERSGVVHRLDRDTSGVLILAKTQEAFLHLKTQFHERHVQKEYRAFVYGVMKETQGVVDRPIGRSTRDFRLRSAEHGARGTLRNAVTKWHCLQTSDTHSYLKILPKTGRTHQIRVHMKSLSRPIVCDELYAPSALLKNDSLGFTRLALHAYSITFTLLNGIEKTSVAELPPDFERAIELLR